MRFGSPGATCELVTILNRLNIELAKLDSLGAGIAAAHVDAAVGHLRMNLNVANENQASIGFASNPIEISAEIFAENSMTTD